MQVRSWSRSNVADCKRLERAFANRSIPIDAPGFYDAPAFLEAEAKDPRFLENYARYVEARDYDSGYLEVAAGKIQSVAKALEQIIAVDGRLGACVDACGMLGRMLDRLGVWNYVAKATLTIEFPAESHLARQHFWVLDEGAFVAAHAIVVAPPFGVVDVTLRHQHYKAEQARYLPPVVVADDWRRVDWAADDLANAEIRESLRLQRVPFEVLFKAVIPQCSRSCARCPPVP